MMLMTAYDVALFIATTNASETLIALGLHNDALAEEVAHLILWNTAKDANAAA